MTGDVRVSTSDHDTETFEVLGPSDARRCDHCGEPPEWEVRHTLQTDIPDDDPGPIHWDLCGTCLARMHLKSKREHDVTIVQRAR
jgi:hypothetical protein